MLKSIAGLTAVCGCFLLCQTSNHAQTKIEKAPAEMKRDDVFGPDKLWTIHLKIGAKEYQDMTPSGGMMMFGAFGGKKDAPPPKKEEKKPVDPNRDVHKSKGFGMEFPWVKGELEFNDKLVKEVGIRYTGNSTYQMSAQGPKRPFKVDVNHYLEDQKVFGMGGLTLRNGVADSTRIRDALGYAIFRAAGVPAPRTAFVKFHLSVPTKYDKTYVGVYTLVESVDKPFLKANFGSNEGMLLKPEKVQGLPYMGENWNAYKDRYNPKREPTDAQKKRLIEFTKLVNQSSEATFQQKIGDYLDVENFLRFAAANSIVANLDSFFGLGHNYYLYLNPKDNKFHFIPWDLDLAFGGMGFGGGSSDQIEWSIAEPYMGKNRLTERVLAIKEHNDAYRKHMRTLAEGAYSPKTLSAMIAVLEKTIRDAKEPAAKGGFGFGSFGGPKQDLRGFTTKRAESVLAQLDGTSPGKQLAGFNFGGKGPPGGAPKGPPAAAPGSGNRLAKAILDFADINMNNVLTLNEIDAAGARLFKEAGGDDKSPVTEQQLSDTINRIMPAPQGFGGFKPPPPKGAGPGKGIAAAILKNVGAAADKTVSREAFLDGAEMLFKHWDKDKNGCLDEKEIADGLSQFVPRPEFGPGISAPKKNVTSKETPKEKTP